MPNDFRRGTITQPDGCRRCCKIISAAGMVSSVASRSACAASTRRRDSAVTLVSSRDSFSAIASSRSRTCTACTIFANELIRTPISSERSVWCAAVKSPCSIRLRGRGQLGQWIEDDLLGRDDHPRDHHHDRGEIAAMMAKKSWRRSLMTCSASFHSSFSRRSNSSSCFSIRPKSSSVSVTNCATESPGSTAVLHLADHRATAA